MPPKIIVDAGILISAYGSDGEIRRYWRDSLQACKIVASPEILIEAEARLRNGEFSLSGEAIREALADILRRCEVVRPNPPRDPKFPHAKDAHLAALAKCEHPDGVRPQWLLTEDAALQRLLTIGNCKVAGIGEFCNSQQLAPLNHSD